MKIAGIIIGIVIVCICTFAIIKNVIEIVKKIKERKEEKKIK